ncbi:MAG: hypothetical protein M1479_10630 [Actinobacteria bacterium]|nr:hypothetical protein [Actinomycetota bacterium]
MGEKIYKVIAQQGDDLFLISTGVRSLDKLEMAMKLDITANKIYVEMPVGSYLARGYWEDFKGDEEDILRIFNKLLK